MVILLTAFCLPVASACARFQSAGDVMSGEHVRDQDWHARTGRAEEMSDLCRIKVLCYRERGPRVRISGASAALRGPLLEDIRDISRNYTK